MIPQNAKVSLSQAVARDAALPEKGDYILRDTKVRYLGLRVYAGGTKVWIVQKKLGKSPCKVILGNFKDMTYTTACGLVPGVVTDISKGIDPNLVKRQQVQNTVDERTQELFTVTRCFEEYVSDKKASGKPPKPLTLTDWHRSLARIRESSLGSTPLARLTGNLLAEYYDTAAKQAKRLTSNGGRTQAGRDLRYLRAAYKVCGIKFKSTLKFPIEDPFADLNKLREGWYLVKSKTRIIGRVEGSLKKWWEAVEGLRPPVKPEKKPAHKSRDVLADYLELSLLWGGRRGEVLSLKWDAVSLEDGVVCIAGADTKNELEHMFPITRYARQLLEKRHQINITLPEPSPWVFPSPRTNSEGVRSHIVEAASAIAAVAEVSGCDFSAHDLRRTFATLLNEIGVNEYSVKRALNHSPHDTASKHYIKARIAALRPMYQQFEDKLLIEAGVLTVEPPKVSVSAEDFAKYQAWLAGQVIDEKQ